MDKQLILSKLKELKERSKKRKFSQSIDLIVNLQQLDLKKPENKIDIFIPLPHDKGKKPKICGLVDNELVKESRENLDYTITKEEFRTLSNEQIKKLSREFDLFIAQANIMADVAKTFGRIFGPKGKMPNPKAGCVVPGNVSLKPLKERLEKSVRLQTKNEVIVKTLIGKESMNDEELADNILTLYNSLLSSLPQEKNNIREVLIKLTMSAPIKVE
ncbi:MAG: 50S ribosomal protein L1 [Candidatus Nanoarchaeia archaeon]|jgi:large subunit ribosomal protein L1|nr:50S ribosomal protein L1 [Candidatus Nanoarchaeia archaeon]|tara:strand:- start:5595 stop:6242 length:648 start_codon:yes stop_codon:yes gene_type:complete